MDAAYLHVPLDSGRLLIGLGQASDCREPVVIRSGQFGLDGRPVRTLAPKPGRTQRSTDAFGGQEQFGLLRYAVLERRRQIRRQQHSPHGLSNKPTALHFSCCRKSGLGRPQIDGEHVPFNRRENYRQERRASNDWKNSSVDERPNHRGNVTAVACTSANKKRGRVRVRGAWRGFLLKVTN